MKGRIMRTVISLIVVALLLCFVAGCGPGQPFEIEGRTDGPATGVTDVAADTNPTPITSQPAV